MRRTCQRVSLTTGEICEETVRHGITSLPPTEAPATTREALWRGHWAIENRGHRERDVSMGNDARQVRVGRAPQALAA